MKEVTLNMIFFSIFVLMLCIGVVGYDFLGLDIIDETAVLGLFTLYITSLFTALRDRIYKEFIAFGLIAIFYLLYSLFFVRANINEAIWTDFFIQIKPFVAFYSIYAMGIIFCDKQKKWMQHLCLALSALTLIVVATENSIIFFGHQSRLATTSIILSVIYLYCSNGSLKERVISILILSIGLFSQRAKLYGFYVIAIPIIMLPGNYFSIKWRTIIIAIGVAVVTLAVSWSKISYYYITGVFYSEELFARPALFLVSAQILYDYFPFGSGLGSFATHASSIYYSPLYYKYGLDSIFGLSPQYRAFISDTFIPTLAQFGVVGITLWGWFWVRVAGRVRLAWRKTANLVNMKIGILIILFFIFESVADSTIIQNRGVMMMMLLAMVTHTTNSSSK